MSNAIRPSSPPLPRQRYAWPWFVAAAVLLGTIIAVIAVKREADRVRERKQLIEQFPAPKP